LAIEFPGGSQSAARITSAEIPLDDGWHHVALCVTPTRRQIYWDGKPAIADPAQQSDAIRTHWSPSPANLMLGKRGTINREVGRKETLLLRAFRLSSTLRYQKEFKPPPTFERDEHTQVLLDFSHNGGKFIPNTCDEKRSGLVAPAQWREVDKTW
jgi:hypothetical protein